MESLGQEIRYEAGNSAMQQPMHQQDQLGCPQTSQQQMVLCPVRFVYETQILIPPGEHIQPNQTFIINSQNLPPWIQNRTTQNQVIYVQQLPNNILPSLPQHVDQNQMYVQQNYPNYQIQQPMLVQNQDTRALTNIAPNTVQNIQNERNNSQNLSNISSQFHGNTQMIQNQFSQNRQIPTENNQNFDVQRQYMRPQMTQTTITRPIMTVNQTQNVPFQQSLTTVPNIQQQVNFGQTFVQNIGQQRPSIQNLNIPRNVQPTNMQNLANMPNIKSVTKVKDVSLTDANKSINNSFGNCTPITNMVGSSVAHTKNFVSNYAYRPIQPRPQFRHNSTQVQVKSTPIQNPSMYATKNIPQNTVKVLGNVQFNNINNITNRKRKSESPDELQNKIAITAKPNYDNIAQSITVTKLSNEIGVNTSPIHRIESKYITANYTMPQINSDSQHVVRSVDNVQKVDETVVNIPIEANASDKEKLIRNTVFTQARGRLHHDVSVITNDINTTSESNLRINDNIPSTNAVAVTKGSSDNEIIDVKPLINAASEAEIPLNQLKSTTESNPEINKTEEEIKPNVSNDKGYVIKEEVTVVKQIDAVKNEKLDTDDKIVIKNENDTILTHVLDGYVIQESSFAFPIRKPLLEKTLQTNTQANEQTYRDGKSCPIDLPLLPFHYLHLNNERLLKPSEKNNENDETSTPFSSLEHTTVKSWTVEELAKHLSKHDWKETVSVLRDHEIDGESLFLVTKSQLVNIGVNDEHAEVICEFVKS